MWVRFVAAFDWNPPERHGRVTLSYPAGAILFVRRACAAAAIAAGRAVATTRNEA